MTDIYFFDKKQAIKDFDNHYKSFTLDDPKNQLIPEMYMITS